MKRQPVAAVIFAMMIIISVKYQLSQDEREKKIKRMKTHHWLFCFD